MYLFQDHLFYRIGSVRWKIIFVREDVVVCPKETQRSCRLFKILPINKNHGHVVYVGAGRAGDE